MENSTTEPTPESSPKLPQIQVMRRPRVEQPYKSLSTMALAVPFAAGLLWAAVVLYLCLWLGERLPERNGAYWPCVAVASWAFFSAGLNLKFARQYQRLMAAQERRRLALLTGATCALVLGCGGILLAAGEAARAALDGTDTGGELTWELLRATAKTIVLAAPGAALAGWLAVCPAIQRWWAQTLHLPTRA